MTNVLNEHSQQNSIIDLFPNPRNEIVPGAQITPEPCLVIGVTCLPALETGQLSDLEGLVVLDPSLQVVQQKLQDLSPLDTLRGIHILSGFGQAIHLVPNSPGLDALPDSTREV